MCCVKYTGTHPKGSSQPLATWWCLHGARGGGGEDSGHQPISCTCAGDANSGQVCKANPGDATFQLPTWPNVALVSVSCCQVLCAVVVVCG